MPKPRITKTLSLDRAVTQTIERIARQEKRSFTSAVEILLERALERRQGQPTPEAQG
jgi:hypothetical protein